MNNFLIIPFQTFTIFTKLHSYKQHSLTHIHTYPARRVYGGSGGKSVKEQEEKSLNGTHKTTCAFSVVPLNEYKLNSFRYMQTAQIMAPSMPKSFWTWNEHRICSYSFSSHIHKIMGSPDSSSHLFWQSCLRAGVFHIFYHTYFDSIEFKSAHLHIHYC